MSETETLVAEPNPIAEGTAAETKPVETLVTAADAKPVEKAAEAKAEPVKAEPKYEFTVPKDASIDAEVLKTYSEAAKELKLSPEAAQKVLDKMVPVMNQRQIAQMNAVREQWATEAKADKEFGGEKLSENLAVARKALDLGTPELRTLLNESGLGNHPEVIRWMFKVGKLVSEDGFVKGTHVSPETSLAKQMYPNSDMK